MSDQQETNDENAERDAEERSERMEEARMLVGSELDGMISSIAEQSGCTQDEVREIISDWCF